MKRTVVKLPEPYYGTEYGAAYLGDALELVKSIQDDSVNLIMTSPPFALNKKSLTVIRTRISMLNGLGLLLKSFGES